MKIASIVENDGVNSITGFTLSIFTQGCGHRCQGCFSEQTWDYKGGLEYDLDEIKKMILTTRCKNVSILGGDPFFPLNRNEIIELIKWIKTDTNKILYVWTGYLKEEVDEWIDTSVIDYLIDGKFIKEKRNLKLILRGSDNQNIYKNGVKYNIEEELK